MPGAQWFRRGPHLILSLKKKKGWRAVKYERPLRWSRSVCSCLDQPRSPPPTLRWVPPPTLKWQLYTVRWRAIAKINRWAGLNWLSVCSDCKLCWWWLENSSTGCRLLSSSRENHSFFFFKVQEKFFNFFVAWCIVLCLLLSHDSSEFTQIKQLCY